MKKFFGATIFLCLFVALVFLYFFNQSSSVSNTDENKVFVVNKGDSLDLISTRLKQSSLIRHKNIFKINAYLLGLHSKLRAGSFNLSTALTNQKIAQILSTGGSQDNWIQLIEGWRNEEIATYLEENKFFSAKSFLFLTKDKQGYIFPDTYSIPQNKDLDFFIESTLLNFDQKYKKASQDKQSVLDQNQTIVIASLLEREANNLEAKKMVSAVIYNRLSIGMPLQIDATVQYVKDTVYPPQKYWQPITKSDLSIDHPSNTYKYAGLPSEPICNPSYNAIFAAINPVESDYLYYITGNDGQMYYAKTLEEHNLNIGNYLR